MLCTPKCQAFRYHAFWSKFGPLGLWVAPLTLGQKRIFRTGSTLTPNGSRHEPGIFV